MATFSVLEGAQFDTRFDARFFTSFDISGTALIPVKDVNFNFKNLLEANFIGSTGIPVIASFISGIWTENTNRQRHADMMRALAAIVQQLRQLNETASAILTRLDELPVQIQRAIGEELAEAELRRAHTRIDHVTNQVSLVPDFRISRSGWEEFVAAFDLVCSREIRIHRLAAIPAAAEVMNYLSAGRQQEFVRQELERPSKLLHEIEQAAIQDLYNGMKYYLSDDDGSHDTLRGLTMHGVRGVAVDYQLADPDDIGSVVFTFSAVTDLAPGNYKNQSEDQIRRNNRVFYDGLNRTRAEQGKPPVPPFTHPIAGPDIWEDLNRIRVEQYGVWPVRPYSEDSWPYDFTTSQQWVRDRHSGVCDDVRSRIDRIKTCDVVRKQIVGVSALDYVAALDGVETRIVD